LIETLERRLVLSATTVDPSQFAAGFQVTNDWGSGFGAQVSILDKGQAPVEDWTVSFDFDRSIDSIWNARITSHVGNHYVISNAGYNATIAPSQSVSFGFNGSAGNVKSGPTNWSLVSNTSDNNPPPAGSTVTNASASFTVTNDWGSGFGGQITVKNNQSTPITDWSLAFDFDRSIDSIWNAKILSHVGNHYVITNPGYNATIAAGGSVSFGFNGSAGGVKAGPSDFVLNGVPISGGSVAPVPSLSINDVSVTEGDATNVSATFKVSLSAASTKPVTVAYATRNVTATAGTDYNAAQGFLSFAPGETSKSVTIAVKGGTTAEPTETYQVVLSTPTNATIGKGAGTGTILDNDTPPGLSIGNVSVTEGDSANVNATFHVTLSSAWTKTVSVSYATKNVNATAPADYVAASGTLTFAPGETSKTVTIAVKGDLLAESTESFQVVLSSPVNATLTRSIGTGTILDNDDLPTLSITDATALEGDSQTSSGFFHTSGNQILDSSNRPVKIAGVNWFGMESSTYAPHGLWTKGYKEMMDQMKSLGFNTIRMPFSNQLFDANSKPNGIDFSKNPDLQGLSGLQILDKIVDYAGQIGLRIFLDHHRSDAGAGTETTLWYTSSYPESRWISDWTMLAAHYAGNATVIGADLHNEPHGDATWGTGTAKDWRLAAQRAGNAILAVNPNWLIIVEGVENGPSGSDWWGGNLSAAGQYPVELNVPGRLVYSPHDYPNSIYPQQWFSDPNFPNNLPAVFDKNWGYLFRTNTAPILLGEFGSKLVDPKDVQWLDAMVKYLAGDLDGDGKSDLKAGEQGISWTWWSWNPNSGDTGGILKDDWSGVNQNKVDALKPLMFAFPSGTQNGTNRPPGTLAFTVRLSVASTSPVTVRYTTADGTAKAGTDYVAGSGTITFAPGETERTIYIPAIGDTLDELDETFTLILSSPVNAKLSRAAALGTLQDDEGPDAM
jgi:chitinase